MTVSSRTKVAREEALMKLDGEIMEILAAYDLTGSLRAAAELTGCSHHTVARHVAARDAGQPIAEPAYRGRVTDAFLPKIEEWIEASKGKIRADKALRCVKDVRQPVGFFWVRRPRVAAGFWS